MGSKEEAIEQEPDRFSKYLSDKDIEFIARGTTQADRIHRLKERFEESFPQTDIGERFIAGGGGKKDYDLRTSSDYAKAIEALYDSGDLQNRLKKYALPIMKERIKEAEVIEKEKRIMVKVLTLDKIPKSKKIFSRGYRNKKGKMVEGYQRMKPEKWSSPQEKWLKKNYAKWTTKAELQIKFNDRWGTKRMKSSITTRFYRMP